MPSSKRINFPGHNNLLLEGRLELPDGAPLCFATFSHCFTCTKDMLAAYRISKALAQNGIATLRFDFAGLGHSQGVFADSNFSTTKIDLLAAADFLAREYESPQLLIGHSMGGTTALACADKIKSVKGVVTIASPSQPEHVLHHFGHALTMLEQGFSVSIEVAGKPYDINPQFLEDIRKHDLKPVLEKMHIPVLIFNIEHDALVDEDNATEIGQWTAGKSDIITLKNADHILSSQHAISTVTDEIMRFYQQL